ncbi:MAG: diphthamide biosynthesis enzyme Dph2 [Nanoarchaeota archaeon]
MKQRFDFQIDYVIEEIKKRRAKKIMLQFAEGIKIDALEVVAELNKKVDCDFVVSGDSAWGGCDLAIDDAKKIGADLIVHFGHAPFIKIDFPIVYVYVKDNKDLNPLIKKSLKDLKKYESIGLVSSIQHIHKLNEIKEFYGKNGKKVKIPRAVGFSYIDGHVVGCEYTGLKQIKDEVDCVVVLGNRFHSLGAALSVTNKPVFLIDTYNDVVESMDKFRNIIIKQRNIAIHKIKDAKKIGIIIGTKPGQKFGSYNAIKKELEKQGKEVLPITMNEMTTDKILNFYNIQGFVELACPRIATDDYGKYERPIITFREALVVIGKLKWVDLLEKGFV